MNNEIRNTKYEPRFGFTLVELVVAIGIMALVILFAGTVFKTSISSYRVAMAQTEIMQKLRAITQQLDSDFRGLRKDAPMFIHFETSADYSRFDQIMFFADGDFQSTGQNTIVGNLARIYYGHSRNPSNSQAKDRLFARCQHILTADESILLTNRWPDSTNFAGTFGQSDPLVTYMFKNDTYEYDWLSLSQWQALTNDLTNGPANVSQIINVCFGNSPDFNDHLPYINTADANTIHNLMTQGIGSFCVQWGYYCISHGAYFWWPSLDPNGSGNTVNSDFLSSSGMGYDSFGLYLNSVAPTAPANSYWFPYSKVKGYYYPDPSSSVNPAAKPTYPQALKFAFTIFDSRGVFKDGQTFTHIVYLGD
ncbi:MAG: prepilin-type N-terminal cleavage/methylation domain-containing protein [Sedimentisphaerales bacterium]|jgi:prepilin-type N-terminal cleavage/methylation domain-containing protein